MEFTNYKIGYWPYRLDCKGPGDRRRFVFFADEKKLNYEIASPEEKYDILYLNMGCDISSWINYKRRNPAVKMVFEIVDSYFLEGLNFFTIFRGVTRFLSVKESKLYIDYRKAIIQMLQTADAVVCSTEIQKQFLLKYNRNVHVSLDFFLNDITHTKTNYSVGEKLKLVWEGQTYTLHNLYYLNDIFKKLSDKIELHIITDPVIQYPFKVFNKKTKSLLTSLNCTYYQHKWDKETFSKIIAESDLAIIPLNDKKYGTITMNKPENKLLLFWQIGIPVITSSSMAYKKVMDKADLSYYCSTKEEWDKKLEAFIQSSETEKKDLMKKASAYIDQFHSKEIIIQNWEKIFLSLYHS